MKHKHDNLKALTRLTIQCCFLATAMAITTNAIATTENTAFVDSVHNWGAWALDIEPAAGGLQTPGTQPLHARTARVSLRTNSMSALAPSRPQSEIMVTPSPNPTPRTPTPSAPTPPPPPVTPPVGGPADGLF